MRDDMKVFISYGDAGDQVTALRLQALGAANGLTVYVPPAHTRQGPEGFIDPTVSQKLSDAEVVLGFIGNGLSEACRQELNTGMALHKNMIVMSYPDLAAQLQPYFGQNLVVIDPQSIRTSPSSGLSSTSNRSTLNRMQRRPSSLWAHWCSGC